MFRLMGVFTIIPITMFLAVSFFVLFSTLKVDSKALKAFGKAIAVLLWICALIVFMVGSYTLITGRHPMIRMMHGMMMEEMCPMMKGGGMGHMGMGMEKGVCPMCGMPCEGMEKHEGMEKGEMHKGIEGAPKCNVQCK